MKKKNILTLSGIVLGIAMCFGFNSVSAIESAFTGEKITRNSIQTVSQANALDASSETIVIYKNKKSGNKYQWNLDAVGDGPTAYWITDQATRSKVYYCLNATRGFNINASGVMTDGATKEYTDVFEMKNQTDKANIIANAGGNLGTHYNQVLWILDNAYISGSSSEQEKSDLLRKAMTYIKGDFNQLNKLAGILPIGIANSVISDDMIDSELKINLTDEEIEVVQQMAIWYFTNSNDTVNYHLLSGTLPAMYLNGGELAGDTEGFYWVDDYMVNVNIGAIKEWKMNALFMYLINNASDSYSNEAPTLSINTSSAIVQEYSDNNYFVSGPYLLTGTNANKITKIQYQPFVNGGIFVNKDGVEITNLKSYIGNTDGIYFRIPKSSITTNTVNGNVNFTYYYDTRALTYLTDTNDPINTQAVVTLDDTEKNISLNINVEFELMYVEVTKQWDDNNNQDGKRVENVKVQLYENGVEKGNSITLNSSNNWEYTWEKLLVGNAYDVKELDSSNNAVQNNGKYNENYTTKYEYVDIPSMWVVPQGFQAGCRFITITNTHVPEVISKTVTKIWEDANNQDGKRPQSIQVQLLANGQAKGDKVTILDNNGQWSHTWNNLPKYENGGQEIKYTVVEDGVNEYVPTYSDDTFTITNSYTPGKLSKTIIKNWEDENNLEGIRPSEVTVTLYKITNGQEIEINSQKLNQDNNWRYTWEDLAQRENGVDIVYLVKEASVEGYTTTYSAENYKNTNTITITNTHIPTIKGSYIVSVRKVDNNGSMLSDAVISVNGKDYTLGSAQIEKQDITSEDDIILTYEIEEKVAPQDYIVLSEKKNIKIKLEIEKLGIAYIVKRAYIIDKDGNQITDTNINVGLDSNDNTIKINIVNNPAPKDFDFSLRKFITNVTSVDGKKSETYNREPIVNPTIIGAIDENGKTITTASYQHTKEPIAVEIGDIVTYTIRVYNEGEADGYVSEIKDHLPEWLEFLPEDELNLKYLWQQDINNTRIITTSIASKDSASGENIYSDRENKQLLSAYNGGATLDYIDVQVRCKVNEKATEGQLITNIADISKMQDINGIEVLEDIDSTINNVEVPEDINLPNYKGNEENKDDLRDKDYYYEGQEDDDDFEKLIVKRFDLSLRKFIIALNGTELKSDVIEGNVYTREPVVDTSKLGTLDENGNTITTATYTHPKNAIEVQKGDIVTYIIRIYNEGSLAGYAHEIIENIPEGLEFIADSEINKQYGWILRQDGKLVSSYLSDKILNNTIEDVNGKKVLDHKDLQIELKVVADPAKYIGNIITNWAEINIASNKDIDSTPGNDIKTEDDIDYEPVKLVYFDLALRKFITNVNGTEYNNRMPEVDTSKLGTIDEITGEKITTAEYKHTKDPVVLETENTVIYTIRVYNEGNLSGYANEIVDNLPEGLEFLPENQTNIDYKWTMIDEEGNITQDVSKAKKITTNYLSENNDITKIIDGYKDENGVKTLSYQDVKVAFKVVEPNSSNRIVINTAEISKSSMEDIDSIPGNNENIEDDIDNEYLRVETFDLALEKWVKATKVTYKGKTKTTKTGFTAESTEMAKVDLVASQLSKTTVKFVYCIRVINEGQVAGYATEIKDYVPSGLKFVAKDNPNWVYDEKDKTVTTTQLKDKLLQPGQSETIEIVLTWKNSASNLGVKTNWAEISADSGEDIDSTPDNYNKIEDDIDDAKVILSIKTGGTKTYIALAIAAIVILGSGAYLVKKKVLVK